MQNGILNLNKLIKKEVWSLVIAKSWFLTIFCCVDIDRKIGHAG